jgi:hypothetical protein
MKSPSIRGKAARNAFKLVISEVIIPLGNDNNAAPS